MKITRVGELLFFRSPWEFFCNVFTQAANTISRLTFIIFAEHKALTSLSYSLPKLLHKHSRSTHR